MLVPLSLAALSLLASTSAAPAPCIPQAGGGCLTPRPPPSNPIGAVTCQAATSQLTASRISECEAAIAGLPAASTALNVFTPVNTNPIYKVPVTSNHNTQCTARVDFVPNVAQEKASWTDIRNTFQTMVTQCLDGKGQVGKANVGQGGGLVISLVYGTEEVSGSEPVVTGKGTGCGANGEFSGCGYAG